LQDDSSLSLAYLKEMVSFCRIASDVRSYFLGTLSSRIHDAGSTQDYLQFRVNQWQQNLPHRLKFNSVHDKLNMAIEKRGDYKLRLMLYLRANQMQTIILRKAASRFGSNNIDTSDFEIMIRVARDSIQVLAGLARETDSTVAGDSLRPVPSTGMSRADQDFSFLEADANRPAGHMTNLVGDPALLNGAVTANIPIGLFDLDTVDATWADTDPSLFTNLSQILGSCEGFTFF
jgi:hypothetical protein